MYQWNGNGKHHSRNPTFSLQTWRWGRERQRCWTMRRRRMADRIGSFLPQPKSDRHASRAMDVIQQRTISGKGYCRVSQQRSRTLFDFCCYILCLFVFGLMINLQKQLNKWARFWNIINQSLPNHDSILAETSCRNGWLSGWHWKKGRSLSPRTRFLAAHLTLRKGKWRKK